MMSDVMIQEIHAMVTHLYMRSRPASRETSRESLKGGLSEVLETIDWVASGRAECRHAKLPEKKANLREAYEAQRRMDFTQSDEFLGRRVEPLPCVSLKSLMSDQEIMCEHPTNQSNKQCIVHAATGGPDFFAKEPCTREPHDFLRLPANIAPPASRPSPGYSDTGSRTQITFANTAAGHVGSNQLYQNYQSHLTQALLEDTSSRTQITFADTKVGNGESNQLDQSHLTQALLEVTQKLDNFLQAYEKEPVPAKICAPNGQGKTKRIPESSLPKELDIRAEEAELDRRAAELRASLEANEIEIQIPLPEDVPTEDFANEPPTKVEEKVSIDISHEVSHEASHGSPGSWRKHFSEKRHWTKADETDAEREEQAEESLDVIELKASMMDFKEPDSMAGVFLHDDEIEKPLYSVDKYYYEDGIAQQIARSSRFANVTVAVVGFNAVYIGVESDHNDAQNIYKAHLFFQVCSQFFCVYFTGELLIRFFAFAKKGDCMRDGWFKFDTFLVATMIFDTWILMPLLYFIGGEMTIPTQPLRMLRLFKLTRMARLMKAFPELVTMIKGLVRSLRAISSSMILVLLMVYVWSIMMHMLMKEEVKYNETAWETTHGGFGTITQCMWTLIMNGTFMLDNTQPLITGLLFSDEFHYKLAGVAFISYALLSALLILQMLIGILCEVVSQVQHEQRDASALGLVRQELSEDLRIFAGADGKISQQELFNVMNNPRSRALLHKLNINFAFVLELQRMMFAKPGQKVTIKTILQLLVMCRGDCTATVETLAGGLLSVIHEINVTRNIFAEKLKEIELRVMSKPSSQREASNPSNLE